MISRRAPLSMSLIKEQFRILSVAYPITTEIFEHIQSLRLKVYESQDYVEGIQALDCWT